ncbi:hypothetical protein RYX36_012153 [Vicia faba]
MSQKPFHLRLQAVPRRSATPLWPTILHQYHTPNPLRRSNALTPSSMTVPLLHNTSSILIVATISRPFCFSFEQIYVVLCFFVLFQANEEEAKEKKHKPAKN